MVKKESVKPRLRANIKIYIKWNCVTIFSFMLAILCHSYRQRFVFESPCSDSDYLHGVIVYVLRHHVARATAII